MCTSGEEDAIDLEQETKDAKKESSPKPTDALLKDLQTTVHQAKTKIGDLQVPLNVDVSRNHPSVCLLHDLNALHSDISYCL